LFKGPRQKSMFKTKTKRETAGAEKREKRNNANSKKIQGACHWFGQMGEIQIVLKTQRSK